MGLYRTTPRSPLFHRYGIEYLLLIMIVSSYLSLIAGVSSSIEFSVTPSIVHGPPGEEFYFTITYSAPEYTDVYVEYVNTVITPGGGTGILYNVYDIGSMLSLYGEGSIDFSVKTYPQYSGEYTISFKLSDGTVLGTIKIVTDQQPRATVEINETDLSLGELIWFPDPRDWSRNFTMLESHRINLRVYDVNPAIEGAVIKFNASDPSIWVVPDEITINWVEDFDENITIRLLSYTEPGSYKVDVSLTKLLYYVEYDDTVSNYVVVSNNTLHLYNNTINIDVYEAEPPDYILDQYVSIVSADWNWYSPDNVYLYMDLDESIQVDITEVDFEKLLGYGYNLLFHAEIVSGGTLVDENGNNYFGTYIGVPTDPFHVFEAEHSYYMWESVSQSYSRLDRFPYIFLRRTTGTIKTINRTTKLPLTVYSLYTLSRMTGFKLVLRLLDHNPETRYQPDVVYEYYEVYPWHYDPPFYAVMDAVLNILSTNITTLLNDLGNNKHYLEVLFDLSFNFSATRIIGDDNFVHIFHDIEGMDDTSPDTAILKIDLYLVGSTIENLTWYIPLNKLPDYVFGETHMNTQKTSTVEFGCTGDPYTNEYVPAEYDVYSSIGNFSGRIGFSKAFPDSFLETVNYVVVNVSIVDRFFDKVIRSEAITYNVGPLLKPSQNKPPVVNISVNYIVTGTGREVSIEPDAWDPNNDAINYKWLVYTENNSLLYESISRIFDYTFDNPGLYRVTLIVTDSKGASTNKTIEVIVLGAINILLEGEPDIGNIPEANPLDSSYSLIVKVKQLSTGLEWSPTVRNPMGLYDLLQNPNTDDIEPGEYIVTVEIKGGGSEYSGSGDLTSPLLYRVTVVKTENSIEIKLTETWNTWVYTDEYGWSVIPRNTIEKDITFGVESRIRSYETWEKLYREVLREFLSSILPPQDVEEIVNTEIKYEPGAHPHYDIDSDTIVLPSVDDIYFMSLYIPRSGTVKLPKWVKGKMMDVRPDEALETFFHEFGHKLKITFIQPSGFYDKALEYIATGGSHVIYEPFPALLGLRSLSSIGAFDEGHSEFFATLLVEYMRSIPYYNTTTPVFYRSRFYDSFDEQYVFNAPFTGTKYEGYLVEGRIAGALLHLLYPVPEPGVGYNYASNGTAAIRAYSIFMSGVQYCKTLMKRPPMTGREAIYCILARYPELYDKALELAKPSMYNLVLSLNSYTGSRGNVWGRILLVYQYTGVSQVEYMDGAVQRSLSLSPNYMIAFKPTPQSKITLGISSVFIELRDENGVRVFKAYVEDGEVVFHKNGIEFIDVTLAHIISSPSGSFYITVYGLVAIPHSEIVLRKVGNNTVFYVIEGSLELKSNSSGDKIVSTGEKATIDPNGNIVEITTFSTSELTYEWNITAEDSLNTLNNWINSSTSSEYTTKPTISSIIKAVTRLPQGRVNEGSTITIEITLNETLTRMGAFTPIKILATSDSGDVLINKTIENLLDGNKIKIEFTVPYLKYNYIKIAILEGNKTIYTDTIYINSPIKIMIIPIAAIAITIIAIAIYKTRRKHKK